MNDPNVPLNSSPATEPVSPPPAEQAQDPKEAIDLNAIFPDNEKDLNQLFLDADMKQLLKNVSKNKSDLGKLNDRLLEENKGEEEEEDAESSPEDATATPEDPTS